MQQLSTTGLTTSNLMNIATEKGLEVDALVNNKAATYTIQSLDEDDGDAALSPKGDNRRENTVFLQNLVDNFKVGETFNTTVVNRSKRSKASIGITRAHRWFRTLRSIVYW